MKEPLAKEVLLCYYFTVACILYAARQKMKHKIHVC